MYKDKLEKANKLNEEIWYLETLQKEINDGLIKLIYIMKGDNSIPNAVLDYLKTLAPELKSMISKISKELELKQKEFENL